MNYLLLKEGELLPKRVNTKEMLKTVLKSKRVWTIRLEPKHNKDLTYTNIIKNIEIDIDDMVDRAMKDYSCKCTYAGSPDVYYTANGDPGWPGDPPEFDLPEEDEFKFNYRFEYVTEMLKQLSKKCLLGQSGNIGNDPCSLNISNTDRELLFDIADEAYCKEYGSYPDYEEIIDKFLIDNEPYEPEYGF